MKKHIILIALAALNIAFISVMSGCAALTPQTDVCAPYPTATERSYCYASNEVTAGYLALTQSVNDKSLTKAQAVSIKKVLDKADAVLKKSELALSLGDITQANGQIALAREILLEIKR
jgi:hypothetical protein